MKEDKGSISISKEHGVAPALGACCFCGRDNGEIVLLGAAADKLPGYSKYGMNRVHSGPCQSCLDLIEKQGYTGFICDDGRTAVLTPEGGKHWKEQDPTFVPGRIYRMKPDDFTRCIGRGDPHANKQADNRETIGRVPW